MNCGNRFSFLFSIPFTGVVSSPFFFSLPPINTVVVTQIRGHIAGSFPPQPTTVLWFVPCIFFRQEISALSSLDNWRRIVLTHARRSQQLILFYFANKFKTSPRRDSNSRTNTSGIRGLPLGLYRGCAVSVRCTPEYKYMYYIYYLVCICEKLLLQLNIRHSQQPIINVNK